MSLPDRGFDVYGSDAPTHQPFQGNRRHCVDRREPGLMATPDDDQRFAALAACAYEELEAKQERLETEYKIGSFARWHYDQDTALLRLFDENGRARLIAEYIDIGS